MAKLLGDFMLLWATLAFVGFVVLYHLLAEWRETAMGRHVMIFMAVCAAILLYATVATFFTPLPWRYWIRSAVFGSLGVIGTWRIVLLLKEQAAARRAAPIGRHHRQGKD